MERKVLSRNGRKRIGPTNQRRGMETNQGVVEGRPRRQCQGPQAHSKRLQVWKLQAQEDRRGNETGEDRAWRDSQDNRHTTQLGQDPASVGHHVELDFSVFRSTGFQRQPRLQVLSVLRIQDAVPSPILPGLWQTTVVRVSCGGHFVNLLRRTQSSTRLSRLSKAS
jgi:hypothetical protein